MSDSPSVGWREMREEMGVSDGHEPDEDDWDWNPSIVSPDGDPVDTSGYEWDRRAEQREDISEALKEAGDDGLRRIHLDAVIGTDRQRTNKILNDLREDDLVRAHRRRGARRQVCYRWVGDLPAEEIPPMDDDDYWRATRAGEDIREAILEVGLPTTSVEIGEQAEVSISSVNRYLRQLEREEVIDRSDAVCCGYGGGSEPATVYWAGGCGPEDLPEEVEYR